MQETYKTKIIQNLDYLCSNTSNTLVLLNLLAQAGILHPVQHESLVEDLRRGPKYEVHLKLYNTIRKKCDDTGNAFHWLLECLDLSGNESLKNVLSPFGWQTNKINVQQKSRCFNVPTPTIHFVGRESFLDEIHQYWKNNLEQKTLPLLVITGEHGIGKSELASKYVELFRKEVKGHCIWINAKSRNTIRRSFTDLTTEIPIRTSLQEFEIIKSICDHFKSTECIFVFDGVSNYREENFQRFFKRCRTAADPLAIKPFIFLTSVNDNNVHEIFELQAHHVRLTTLNHSDKVEYFRKVFSREDILELTNKLACAINGLLAVMVKVTAHIMDNCRDIDTLEEVIKITLNDIQNGQLILRRIMRCATM